VAELVREVESGGYEEDTRATDADVTGRAVRLGRPDTDAERAWTDLRHQGTEGGIRDPLVREPAPVSTQQRESQPIIAPTGLERGTH
jgi:hypothetical protein